MNKTFNSILLMAALAFIALTSCSLETDGSGDLGGYWHIESVDTLNTGGHLDLSNEKLFWAVQNTLLNVSNRSTGSSYLFQYVHSGDSLLLSDPRLDDRQQGDPQVTDIEHLRPFGINNLEEGFAIESLHSSKMTLRSDAIRISFKKF